MINYFCSLFVVHRSLYVTGLVTVTFKNNGPLNHHPDV